MNKLRRAVIKEEYVSITEDTWEAIILNQFIYWSERVNDFDKFIEEENQRIKKNNTDKEILKLNHGWIYKKAAEMKEEIMSTESEKTISRRISNLVEKGFLDRRNNPEYAYDRTYQYRVNFENVIKALLNKGYMLEGYRINLQNYIEALILHKGQNDDRNIQIDDSESQFDSLKSHNVHLNRQDDSFKGQHVGAIPKTTIKITSETKSNTTTENDSCSDKEVFEKFEQCGFGLLSSIMIEKIKSDIEIYGPTWIMKAVEIADENGKRSYSYVKAILEKWNTNGGMKLKPDNNTNFSNKKESTFNNFKQRSYDFKDLEKKLLGWDQENYETN